MSALSRVRSLWRGLRARLAVERDMSDEFASMRAGGLSGAIGRGKA